MASKLFILASLVILGGVFQAGAALGQDTSSRGDEGWRDRAVIVLKPGTSAVVLDAPTKVKCGDSADDHFIRYCKCAEEGFDPKFTLNLMLDGDGNFDVLGQYQTQDLCEKALSGNPACDPRDSK